MQAIRMYRQRAGLTQPQLAVLSGVDQADISKIENGRLRPGDKVLRRLAGALGVEPWELRYAEEELDRRQSVGRVVEEYLLATAG